MFNIDGMEDFDAFRCILVKWYMRMSCVYVWVHMLFLQLVARQCVYDVDLCVYVCYVC